MSEQVKKTPCNIGLLAHVGASRREPRRMDTSPVREEPGIFVLCGSETISGVKPPYANAAIRPYGGYLVYSEILEACQKLLKRKPGPHL